jgi:uncharacterized membrane protein YfcA
LSHHAFGNINKNLFFKLLLPGIMGAFVGAYLLTQISADAMKPWIAIYLLLMGVVLIIKAVRSLPAQTVSSHVKPLAFFGAFIDAIGGGWRPIVGSTLLACGSPFPETVGSVNAVEFFVMFSASIGIGLDHWEHFAEDIHL